MVVLQDGSEGHSSKREQSATIDIPASCKKGSAQDALRPRSGTQDSNKSTDSMPKGTYGDDPSKPDEGTPPRPLPVGEPAMFERRYSEPVDVIGARASAIAMGGAGQPEGGEGGDEREGKEGIAWSKSAHQLVTSSLPPSSSVAIQIEVG